LNKLEEVFEIAVPEIFAAPETKAPMVDKKEVKTDVSGTMRTKAEKWASGIRDDYKDHLKTRLISRDREILLRSNAKPAGERKPAPPRPPRKKEDKVVAAFTFVLTSGLMPKELAVLRKQESGMRCLDEFEGQVDPTGNELESHIFQLQNNLTSELPEHLDTAKVPEYQIKAGKWVSSSPRMILHSSRFKSAAMDTGNRARRREAGADKTKPTEERESTARRTR
jgi:hypothetical protein